MNPQCLYADRAPYRQTSLPVSHGHRLHVEEWGRPDGIAALVLHGGPGSGCTPLLRRFFDPARYRVVCVDQRGAGRSLPRGETTHNSTPLLLADLRQLRAHLDIARWLVVGGSWGAALALAHAADAPDAVAALLLRASFLARPEDTAAFFDGGPGLQALAAGLASSAPDERRASALAWWRHERQRSGGVGAAGNQTAGNGAPPEAAALDAWVARYRVQAHYLLHGCWLAAPPLLDRCAAVPAVPTLLLHARDDRVCPPGGALALHARLPHAALQWVERGGHDPAQPAMAAAMVAALDHYAAHGRFVAAPLALPMP